MAFKKGKSGNPKGKPKGTKSKYTTVKEGILQTFLENVDNPNYGLEALLKKDMKTFYTIAARLIPQDLSAKMEIQVKKNLYTLPDGTQIEI